MNSLGAGRHDSIGDGSRYVLCYQDEREEWGWHPKYNLEEAVKDFIAEVRAHPEIYH